MARNIVDSGPLMDWTRDNQIYARYRMWKTKVELHFSSTLADSTMEQKSAFLRLWLGDEGLPLIMKWTDTGKLDFSKTSDPPSSGYILQTYWDLLEEELKPRGNRLISIQELFSEKSRQGSRTLNNWLTYIYNLVESCDYGNSKDRIIRDMLFIGCASQKAKDSIVRRGEDVTLQQVIDILQIEEGTQNTLQQVNSTYSNSISQVHYASYEKKPKKQPSTEQNASSTNSTKSCFRCGDPYSKEHEPVCRAHNIFCNECGKKGHVQKVCRSSGKFPKKPQKPNSTDRRHTHYITDAPVQAPTGFYNEQGNWVAEPPRPFPPSIQTVHTLSVIQDIQEIDPETSLTQGMTQSQDFSKKVKQSFSSSDIPLSGSKLHTKAMQMQPIRQISRNLTDSQLSTQFPGDPDIQQSPSVSDSFRDTETDPETTSNADTTISKKFQVSNFRNDLQRKGEVVLSLPINSTQFQQFCKKLNDKELFQCRDLLEKEIYGK